MTDELLHLTDLASERLGASTLLASDDFFAAKERLILPSEPIWDADKYVPTGKWMDGWESRRKRTPGNDWCIVRLGARGILDRVIVDTSHFKGNFPAQCSIEGVDLRGARSPEEVAAATWLPVLERSDLQGDHKNQFSIPSDKPYTHLRLSIYPDGGVARLRAYGHAVPDWDPIDASAELCDLAGAKYGGRILEVSDMFFGHPSNLLMPDRGVDMSDGWESRRRRGPGHDWVIVALGTRGRILRAEVDTLHFKGNAPGHCGIDVCDKPGAAAKELTAEDWTPLLVRGDLRSHENHRFQELIPGQKATHARLRIYPDGGVSRFRLLGRTDRSEALIHGLADWNRKDAQEAAALLTKCCAAPKWADEVVAGRPYACVQDLLSVADEKWRAMPAEWELAFAAHPRIGDKSVGWSQNEQAGMSNASKDTREALVDANKAYEAKFGHVFLICATGKSAEEMLAAATTRLENDASTELANAAEEQRKITHLRLLKGLTE